jgi:hypothetical protein
LEKGYNNSIEDLIYNAATTGTESRFGANDRYKGSRKDWDALDPAVRRKYYSAVSKSIEGVDSPLADKIRAGIGDLGLRGNSNIDTIEQSYGDHLGKFLGDVGGFALLESMKTKGSVRSVVGDMFSAIASGDEQQIAQSRKRLDTLTGDEKAAALAALGRAQTDPKVQAQIQEQFGAKAGAGSLKYEGATYAAARKVDTSMQMSMSAWNKLANKGETSVFGKYQEEAKGVALAGSRSEYAQNWTALVSKMADGGLDKDERSMLVQLSGGQSGAAALGRNVNNLLSDNEKAQREALTNLGVSDDQAAEILSSAKDMRGSARSAQLMQSLTKAGGVLSPDRFSGGTERTVADTEASAWDRQTQFVLAVDSFLARFGKTVAGKAAGLEGMGAPDYSTSPNP